MDPWLARLEDIPIDNPFGLAGAAGTAAAVAGVVGTLLWVAGLVASVVCVVLRLRAAGGVERQQLRWVATGAAAAVVGLLTGASTVAATTPPGPSRGSAPGCASRSTWTP